MARASGHGPDQPVEVAALELVGLRGQHAEVGDAVVAGPGREHLVEREGGQRGEPTGGAAADAEPVGVGVASLDQVGAHGGAVLDVGDAPLARAAGRGRRGRSRWSRGS